MKTLDLRTRYASLYTIRRGVVAAVEVPELSFLMVDGEGPPGGNASFQEAIQLLYSHAYELKFAFRRSSTPTDFPVMPLEALWSMRSGGSFAMDRPREWRWTLMILQPAIVKALHVQRASERIAKRKGLPVDRVRLERFMEGRCIQALHIGPYDQEHRTISIMSDFLAANSLKAQGRHHEIYFSDPRRTAPDKFRTILRQPVVRCRIRESGG